MKKEIVTVVMPVFREKKEHLCQAIESILNQTWSEFKFLIILDDPDNIILKNIIEEYAMFDDRIALYINEKNSGCPYSKDRGIRLAKTEYVAIMDADDIANPCRLEKQINKIIDEALDVVAGCVSVIDDSGKKLYDMDGLPLQHNEIVEKMKVNNCMPHPTWLMRKDVYIKLGGYSDIQGCEDYDFLIRAIKNGYKMGTVGEILLDYRLSEKSISRNNLYKQYLMLQYLQDKYYTHKHNYQSYEDIYNCKYTEKRAEKYAKASIYFEEALAYKSSQKYIKMVVSMFRVLICSKDYCLKIFRYALQNR